MRRGPSRHRLGLMAVCAGLIVLFVWDSVHGQGFRPRTPGMPRPRSGGGAFGGETGYKCENCGNIMVAKSGSVLDKPSSCPKCGVSFINGGLGGTGKSAGGNPAMPPAGGMPAVPPSNFNPTPPPQQPFVPPQQPFTQPPAQAPAQPPMAPQAPANAPISGDASSTSTSTTVAAPSGRSKWLIPGIIALVVLGLLGVGGVWLMISGLKAEAAPPRRSRNRPRRRRRDEDEDDD